MKCPGCNLLFVPSIDEADEVGVADKCEVYESELTREMGYPHWTGHQRGMLEYALKWFRKIFSR